VSVLLRYGKVLAKKSFNSICSPASHNVWVYLFHLTLLMLLFTTICAGYGWLNDPFRMEIDKLLTVVATKSANHTVVPWTNSVPGGAFNWTSIEETRRRRQNDVFKTGKKNPNQVRFVVIFDVSAVVVAIAATTMALPMYLLSLSSSTCAQ
jgi:hypothetical protein